MGLIFDPSYNPEMMVELYMRINLRSGYSYYPDAFRQIVMLPETEGVNIRFVEHKSQAYLLPGQSAHVSAVAP